MGRLAQKLVNWPPKVGPMTLIEVQQNILISITYYSTPICKIIMTRITDLPYELRQQILLSIPGSVPEEIRLDRGGWPDPAHQLLATCKLLRADTIQLMRTWPLAYLISKADDILLLPYLIRAIQRLGLEPKNLKIRLLYFSEIDIDDVRDPSNPMPVYHKILRDKMSRWKDRIQALPKSIIKTIVIDATPLPQEMLQGRPNMVHANLMDENTHLFVRKSSYWISAFIKDLDKYFHGHRLQIPKPPRVSILVGGRFGEISRSYMRSKSHFVGTFCNGEMPTSLSLHRMIQNCGIILCGITFITSGWNDDYILNVSGITIPEGLQGNQVWSDKDFSALSPLAISKGSAVCYYKYALENEPSARAVLIRLLSFAVDIRQISNVARVLEFLPALPDRRMLVHCLSEDLGLVAESIDGQYGTFVRVTAPVDLEE